MSSSESSEYYDIEIINIKTIEEVSNLPEYEYPIYLYIYMDNCPPCKKIKSVLSEMKLSNKVKIYRINLANEPFLYQNCLISKAPTFGKFDKGPDKLNKVESATLNDPDDIAEFFGCQLYDDF